MGAEAQRAAAGAVAAMAVFAAAAAAHAARMEPTPPLSEALSPALLASQKKLDRRLAALEAGLGEAARRLSEAEARRARSQRAYDAALLRLAALQNAPTSADPAIARLAASAGRSAATETLAQQAEAERARADLAALGRKRAALAVDQARLDSLRAAARAAALESPPPALAQPKPKAEPKPKAKPRPSDDPKKKTKPKEITAVAAPPRSPVWPKAKLVRRFGEREGRGPSAVAAKGVTFRLRAAEPVRAPIGGTVLYAGPYRGYGDVLIIGLNGDYALVVTGLAGLDVKEGQAVATGDVLGKMPAAADLPARKGAADLYVEMRRAGRPVNPLRWRAPAG